MEEIRKCVICGKEFVARQWKSNTCSHACWQKRDREYRRLYPKTESGKAHYQKYTASEKERQRRLEHQQDTTVWVTEYGEKQKQSLVEQYARVDVQEILRGLKRYEVQEVSSL